MDLSITISDVQNAVRRTRFFNALKRMTEFVSLRNGPDAPVDAFRLALDLEQRGAIFTVAEGKLRIDGVKVSAEEAAALKRWKAHVIALVEYRVPEVGVDEVGV